MKSICVFCGSSLSNDPSFKEAAINLGKLLVSEKIRLIYGGGNIGLMGILSNTVIDNGGEVTGVFPRFMEDKEISNDHLKDLILVDSMHERKQKMFQLSQGLVALPGGFGTLEEIMEMLTWGQLGLHNYPLGFLNINKFYNHLDSLFQEMVKKDLLKPENRKMALFSDDPTTLLKMMREFEPLPVEKWLDPGSN